MITPLTGTTTVLERSTFIAIAMIEMREGARLRTKLTRRSWWSFRLLFSLAGNLIGFLPRICSLTFHWN
jgi:hypothetical protein